MKEPEIRAEEVETLLDKRFIRVYDLHYAPGRSYFDASRRSREELVATMDEETFRNMAPDAASCVVILCLPDGTEKLLLTYEYRYPAGRFLLGVPAGLVDPGDREKENAALETAKREIAEETGLQVGEKDQVFLLNPLVFSTPGMTDESNALVCAVIHVEDLTGLNTGGTEGAECIQGFRLVDREEAERFLREGRDDYGHFYSVYTWAALMTFVTGRYKNTEAGGKE